ncbi:ribonuclease P protein component [uncultured Brevundimonas sp.]|uniref:ribonuclease P protein component n=1 Tax=uncultured Brevundimonas sp. TaxID=213418 RepID=UPI00260CACCD|nr:ribonuclease P protein component [uncultured Brevundimonas sp.]
MTDPMKIDRLLRRPQFLAAAKGVSQARGAVVIQQLDRADGSDAIRVGFTATRKIGGAVVRNRAKRRLREAARALLPVYGRAGCDYVLIARMGTAERDWDRLLDDVKSALTRLTKTSADMAAVNGGSSDTPNNDQPRRSGQDR